MWPKNLAIFPLKNKDYAKLYSIPNFDTKKFAPKKWLLPGFWDWGGGGREFKLGSDFYFFADKILPNYDLNNCKGILRCSHTGDHSQEDLAKFDYRSIQKETKSYYSLATFCKLLPKAGNFKKIKNSSITTLKQKISQKPFV
jgi:hypothetical protein